MATSRKKASNVVPLRTGDQDGNLPAPPYQPTEQEQNAIQAYDARVKGQIPAVAMKARTAKEGDVSVCSISVDHPDPVVGYKLLSEALATSDNSFLFGLLGQLAAVSSKRSGEAQPEQFNMLLAATRAVSPQDQVETMLGSQMAAVQDATMRMAEKMNKATSLAEMDGYERAFTRLARTFVAQVEALKRYRSKGEQRVIVERVTINEGGQAIVGSVGGRVAGAVQK